MSQDPGNEQSVETNHDPCQNTRERKAESGISVTDDQCDGGHDDRDSWRLHHVEASIGELTRDQVHRGTEVDAVVVFREPVERVANAEVVKDDARTDTKDHNQNQDKSDKL